MAIIGTLLEVASELDEGFSIVSKYIFTNKKLFTYEKMMIIHHFPGIFITTFEISMKYSKFDYGSFFWFLAFMPIASI